MVIGLRQSMVCHRWVLLAKQYLPDATGILRIWTLRYLQGEMLLVARRREIWTARFKRVYHLWRSGQ